MWPKITKADSVIGGIHVFFMEKIWLIKLKRLRPYPESNGDVPEDAVFETATIPLCDMGNII